MSSPTRHASILHALCCTWLYLALSACESSWPPSERASGTSPCCEGRGTCVASEFVERRYAKLLSHTGCTETSVCLPTELQASDRLQSCTAASTGSEGRCMPDCLPDLKRQAGRLARDNCGEANFCVPCYDPVTGAVTGACAVGDDTGPDAAPRVFASCCGNLGRCVPTGLLSDLTEEQRDALGSDTCTGDKDVCVPSQVLEVGASYVPNRCTSSLLDTEGRCLPGCLPALAENAASLRQDGCARGELCAPCYDPITGQSSGSCSFAADPGPSTPHVPLQSCCGTLGKCLPGAQLPSEVAELLSPDRCSQPRDVCAPTDMLEPTFVAQTCLLETLGIEGRCLPGCLPAVADQAALLERASCPPEYLCAPCWNPLTGELTGVCGFGEDPGPTQRFTSPAGCCSGLGLCVPGAVVPAEARELLGPDTCRESQLCAPRDLLENPDTPPRSCTIATLNAEGRCMPNCLPAVQERAAILQRDDCPELYSCVPCHDPTSGDPSGVCATPSDPGPTRPAVVLSECCGGLGQCTPSGWIPEEYASFFGTDSCDPAEARVCVAPDAILSDAQAFAPARCDEPATGAEGRCIPECLPPIAARKAVLARGSCEAAHLCVPCFDPLTGNELGVCSIGADPGPSRPPVTFKACCDEGGEALGVCVPKQLAPPSAADALPVDRCQAAEVCAPRQLLEDLTTPLPPCRSLLTTAGVCVPSCFLPVLTPAGNCPTGQACAPCDQLGEGVGGC